MPGVGERAAKRIAEQWPHVIVVGTYSPPMRFERDEAENRRILERISLARPDALIVGFGAPKQELWVHTWREQIDASVVLCAGATIDFLAGEKKRAPNWMRGVGLEWLHRCLTEPRRLVKRYARDAVVLVMKRVVMGPSPVARRCRRRCGRPRLRVAPRMRLFPIGRIRGGWPRAYDQGLSGLLHRGNDGCGKLGQYGAIWRAPPVFRFASLLAMLQNRRFTRSNVPGGPP